QGRGAPWRRRSGPADPTKTVPDDRISVVDLKDKKVVGTIKVGPGAAGLSIAKDGKRAYVSNRMAGSISILSIDGKRVAVVNTVPLAPPEALVSHIALAPDGKTGVATRNGDAKVVIVKPDTDSESLVPAATLDVAPRPYAAAVTPDGKTAGVARLGDPKGNGMLPLLDLTRDPPGKVVGTAAISHQCPAGTLPAAGGK